MLFRSKDKTNLDITAIDNVVGELDDLLTQLKNDDIYKNGAKVVILNKVTDFKNDKTKVDDAKLNALVKELEDLKSSDDKVTNAIAELKAEQTSRELIATRETAIVGKVKDANDLHGNTKYTDAKFDAIKAAFKGAIYNATDDINSAADKEAVDRKSTRLNSSHTDISRMPSSA